MFKPKNIILLKRNIDLINENESKEYYEKVKKLGYFDSKKLRKTRNLIYEIARTIERESSWVYADKSFTYKDNFHFNKLTDDIIYDLHIVKNDGNGYFNEDYDDIENAFYEKYHDLLLRLSLLEARKDAFYKENKNEGIIEFNKEKNKKSRERQENNFIQGKANRFYDYYGIEGIIELVRYLNLFNKNNTELIYNQFQHSIKSNMYKEDLEEWLQIYSNEYQNYIDLLSSVHDYRQIETEKKDKYTNMAELIYKYRL